MIKIYIKDLLMVWALLGAIVINKVISKNRRKKKRKKSVERSILLTRLFPISSIMKKIKSIILEMSSLSIKQRNTKNFWERFLCLTIGYIIIKMISLFLILIWSSTLAIPNWVLPYTDQKLIIKNRRRRAATPYDIQEFSSSDISLLDICLMIRFLVSHTYVPIQTYSLSLNKETTSDPLYRILF
jgi:hypothetical protein